MSQRRELRRIFRPKRDEVTEIWNRLYSRERHNLYSSPSIIRIVNGGLKENAMDRESSTDGENEYSIFVKKP
jgi:hypothetical protein